MGTARAQVSANVTIDFSKPMATMPLQGIGVCTAVYDNNLIDASVAPMLSAAGIKAVRYSGGSYADIFNWQTTTVNEGGYVNSNDSFDNFMNTVVNAAGAQAIITVNYGSNPADNAGGDTNVAAAWVNHANNTKHWGIKYWEIGNEVGGNGYYGDPGWEYDLHYPFYNGNRAGQPALSPAAYGANAVQFITAMKAQDSSIKCGVSIPQPGTWPDTASPSYNSELLQQCGSLVDFVIIHYYPDGNAAYLLAQQATIPANVNSTYVELTNLVGAAHASQIQIAITETGAGTNTGPVAAIFTADNYLTWIENGIVNVDYQILHNDMLTPSQQPGHAYYGAMMAHLLANVGDTFLTTTSSQALLRVHATARQDGNTGVMLLNTDPQHTMTATVNITNGITLANSGTMYQFGLTNFLGSSDQPFYPVSSNTVSGLGNQFTVTIPPYTIVDLLILNAPVQNPFQMSTVASPQSAGTPFMLSLAALNTNGLRNTTYQSPISLAAVGDGGTDVVIPTNVSAWINGVWVGGVKVETPDANVRLIASDGAGHSVTGNVFNVQLGPLDHFAFQSIPSPQHEAAPFPVTMTAEDAGNNPLTNFNGSVNLAAFAGASNVIFSANFEDGIDGFTINNSIGSANGSGNGLWHLSIGQATNGSHSAYHSLYYGQGEGLSGGGNYNTGGINEGAVTSPVIDLTGQTGPITLSFNYLLDEYPYYWIGDDYAWVEISQNGGPFTSLYYFYPTYYSGWQPFSAHLSSYAGSQIQIRFHFLSNYQYNYQGWYVDDVVVSGGTDTSFELTPANSTAFVSGVWTGAVAVLDAFTNVYLNANDNAGHSGNSSGFAVQGNADVVSSIYSSPATIQAGNSVTYVVFVSNNGPERASLVTLNDPLPPNVLFNYAEVSQGTYADNNNVLTCSFGGLDPGDFAIAVMVLTPQVKMVLTNTVTASTSATDSNATNNTATAVTTVNGEGMLYVYGSDFLPYSLDGGPFNPSGQNYTVQNNGTAALDWSVNSSASWMDISPTSGTLVPFNSTNVFISVNATASGLPFGVYSNSIVFANLTDGNGTTAINGVLTLHQSHVTIDASQSNRTADARWFGSETSIWDPNLDMPGTITILTNMGMQALRFPGGSASDDYHWLYNRQDANNWTWTTSPASFIHVVTNLHAQAMITLNYGTGSTNEAAAWVAYVNAPITSAVPLGIDSAGFNWLTTRSWAFLRASAPLGTDDGRNFLRIHRSAPLGFKYWEIGNEEYGFWETDSNNVAHDPYTYATRARDYISLIKAVDPTAKIGVVVTPGEDSYVNNYTHWAYNPRTGQYHYGWTPVLLSTLQSLGVTPDFVIHHLYPQNPGYESDADLLASTALWASDAADLRQQITDYMGANGTNIELICTENNSVSSLPGKQSTSLVNGLYRADSMAQLMQTEFNGLFWWALRNGTETDGNFSSSLYGWRTYGDYGVVDSGYSNLYPTYYTSKLMRFFIGAGDTVVGVTNDFSLLSAYAVRRLDGGLTILAINKDPSNTIMAPVEMAGFTPAAGGTVYSYGIPQDTAAKTGIGSPDIAQTNWTGFGTNFSYAFPPYSATVLSLSPMPAQLLLVPVLPAQSKLVFQLQGQAGVPYVIQRSTNLITWTSMSTNTLPAGPINITNLLSPSFPMQFWRAMWQP